MFTVKGNKIQLGFNNKYPENNQRVPKTALNVEKTVQMSGFNTVHLVKFIGKGCSIFFSSAYVTLLSTTGYKALKYWSRIHKVYLAAQQQNKLIQFPVCGNIGVLFTLDILSQAGEKHIPTRFSL